MNRTLTITGSLCVYISAVMLVHCSLPEAHSNVEIRGPKIVRIQHRRLCNCYRLTCTVNPGGLKDETLVYWLANGDFLESTYKNISMIKKEKRSRDGTVYLQTSVVFKDLSQTDFQTNFTCIALNPTGFDKKNVQLRQFKLE